MAGRRPFGHEALESRSMMAANIFVMNGDLYIYGTDGVEDIRVSAHGGNNQYQIFERSIVKGVVVTTTTTRTVSGGDIYFYGYGGNDKFWAAYTNLRVTGYGGAGNDDLTGSTAADYLDGEEGDDTIHGLDGNDTIKGGVGRDYLYGDGGDDDINCGGRYDFGYNFAQGGQGNDTIFGGYGGDHLNGNSGSDKIYGLAGDDVLYAGEGVGHDFVSGSFGNDELHGNGSGDKLSELKGGEGKDTFYVDYDSSWWPWTYDPPAVTDWETGELIYENGVI